MQDKSDKEIFNHMFNRIFKRRLNVIWNDVLERSSSKELSELLLILQDFETKQLYSIMDPETLKRILKEDYELLKELAQG